MIDDYNLPKLKKICLIICDVETLRKCYKEDTNLNNLPYNKKSVEIAVNGQLELEKKKIESELKMLAENGDYDKIVEATTKHKKKIRDIKGNYNGFSSHSSLLKMFDSFYVEVRRIANIESLADCTCLLKHIMRYKILNIERPKVFIKE